MEWIKDFEGTGNELVALKAIKDGVVELGTDVCRMFGDLMVAKFHEFKSTLEPLNESKYFVVTKKLIGALETVKKRRRRLQKKMSKKGSLAAVKKSAMSEDQLKKSISEESQIEKLLLQFYHEVYRLDSMLNNPGLPESK
ncbi:hypothetical protein ACOSQ3_011880 [Xanthoceras sorbifolium]